MAMSSLTRFAALLALTAPLHLSNAAPMDQQPIDLSPFATPGPYTITQGKDFTFTINLTFDGMELIETPNKTLTKLPLFEFDRFEVLNTTAAVSKGLLNSSDTDGAVSKPNVLKSIPQGRASNAIIRSNTEELAAINLSPFFDFVSFAAKPLASLTADFISMEMVVWTIDGKDVQNVDSLYIGWDRFNGSFPVFELEPRAIFERWGQKVNWVELSATAYDEDGNRTPCDFCVDNIVMEFRELGRDKQM